MSIPISNELFRDFLNCKYKAYLKLSGKCGQKSDYESLDIQLSEEYRRLANDHLLKSRSDTEICKSAPDLLKALRQGHAIVTDGHATVDDTPFARTLDRISKQVAAQYYESTYQHLFGNSKATWSMSMKLRRLSKARQAMSGRSPIWKRWFTSRRTPAKAILLGNAGQLQGVLVSDFYAAYESVPWTTEMPNPSYEGHQRRPL